MPRFLDAKTLAAFAVIYSSSLLLFFCYFPVLEFYTSPDRVLNEYFFQSVSFYSLLGVFVYGICVWWLIENREREYILMLSMATVIAIPIVLMIVGIESPSPLQDNNRLPQILSIYLPVMIANLLPAVLMGLSLKLLGLWLRERAIPYYILATSAGGICGLVFTFGLVVTFITLADILGGFHYHD